MWNLYIQPQILFGLEVTNIPNSEIQTLEKFQRDTMKQIQSLPPSASNAMTYLLLGMLPMEGALDKKVLTTFCSMLRNQESAEYRIIQRQLAMKSDKSKSWVVIVKKLLFKYHLPSAYDLFLDTPSKGSWKSSVNKAVKAYHGRELKEEVAGQSSCKYVNLGLCSMYGTHNVWASTSSNPREVARAAVKAKVLTGTYNLQAKRSKFKSEEGGVLCKMCNEEPETREHFLTNCKKAEQIRDRYFPNILELLAEAIGKYWAEKIWSKNSGKTQVILDCSRCVDNRDLQYEIERLTRNLIFALHLNRIAQHSSIVSGTAVQHPQADQITPGHRTADRLLRGEGGAP